VALPFRPHAGGDLVIPGGRVPESDEVLLAEVAGADPAPAASVQAGKDAFTSPGSQNRTSGAELIAAERRRQVEQEGYTATQDAGLSDGSLANAAACYAIPPGERLIAFGRAPVGWPWSTDFWKPTPLDRVRELVKAGALIAAEIDRLLVAEQPEDRDV